MERTLSALLLLVASIAISIALGGWWMQRIAFTPDDSRDTAAAILGDADIRQEINTVITGASAARLAMSTTELGSMLEFQVLDTRAGAAVLGPIIKQAHQRILGLHDDPVLVTGVQMIDIVRDQRAADVPTVTLPVPVIGTLKTFRTVTRWLIPIAAAIGAILLLVGIVVRPERHELVRALGEFGIALAVSLMLFGYLIPVHLLTAIDNSTWANAIPRLAARTFSVVLGMSLIFGVGGLALIAFTRGGDKRSQFSRSTSASRYRNDGSKWA